MQPVLTLLNIECLETNDIDQADELQCRIVTDELHIAQFKQIMHSGQQWTLNESVRFSSMVSIQLWEEGKYKPFYIGQADIIADNIRLGEFSDEFHNGAARYVIRYKVDSQVPESDTNPENSETSVNSNESGTVQDSLLSNSQSNREIRNFSTAPFGTPVKTVHTGFLPDKNGFRFANYFAAKLPFVSKFDSTYGLCGGMVKAAADFFEHNLTLPDVANVPKPGSALYRYLLKRQFQSFGTGYFYLVKFFNWWFTRTTPKTQELTALEWKKIKPQLDQKRLVQFGMVYVDRHEGKMWENHQVLAYAYEEYSGNFYRIYIYDPNYPKRNDIYISAQLVSVPDKHTSIERLICEEQVPGWMVKPIRGFFEIPLNSKRPPAL